VYIYILATALAVVQTADWCQDMFSLSNLIFPTAGGQTLHVILFVKIVNFGPIRIIFGSLVNGDERRRIFADKYVLLCIIMVNCQYILTYSDSDKHLDRGLANITV
jgi:hypothetical protein